MPRSGPTTLALPPFTGATRRLILINIGIFFGLALAERVLPGSIYNPVVEHLALMPWRVVHGELWQPLTYIFLQLSILGTLLSMLLLWFTGPIIEDGFSSRWLYELYLVSGIGGALVASAVSFTHLFGLQPDGLSALGIGPSAALYGLLAVIAIRFGDMEFLLLFIIRVKAKYLVAIYILVDLATLLKTDAAFGALLGLSGALCGFLFLRFAPRRGLGYLASERWFALRNDFYRAKRRRAAKKFEVYMRKQNRDVRFDQDGRYIDPDIDPVTKRPRDPKDRSWMN
jgi:membrane associated rhomboid family serine protease